jgi:hypothetical protein
MYQSILDESREATDESHKKISIHFIFTLVWTVQFGHAEDINNNGSDALKLPIPQIAAPVEVRQTPLTAPPNPLVSPENTKFPPRKVNPKGMAPPSSLPPHDKAVWPVCPDGLCKFN